MDDDDKEEDSSSLYESSELEVSSSPSEMVSAWLKKNNIPKNHIDKHFKFKSPKKKKSKHSSHKNHKKRSKNRYKNIKNLSSHFLPSASHNLIRIKSINSTTSNSSNKNIKLNAISSNKSSKSTKSMKSSPSTISVSSDSFDSDDIDDLLDFNKPLSRITKHHWWTRRTIQITCVGIMIIEFSFTIIQSLIIPYLFLSNTPYYCISWILFFIPIIDSWLQPLIYIKIHKLIHKYSKYWLAQLCLFVFMLIFLCGFIIIPYSNVITAQLFHNKWYNHGHDHIHKHKHHDIKHIKDNNSVDSIQIFVSILGYTIVNLSLGYMLIPLRFILNNCCATISSKQFFSLRNKIMNGIYDDPSCNSLSKKSRKRYITSFDGLITHIYNINEYNHYIKYCQRSISIYQLLGRSAGYLFASIDWIRIKFIDNNWIILHKYGHIALCFTFTAIFVIIVLSIVIIFITYVQLYANKKINKKKRKFYNFRKKLKRLRKEKKYNTSSNSKMRNNSRRNLIFSPFIYPQTPMSLYRNRSMLIDQSSNILESLIPSIQSKIAYDLTRICNINPRVKCSYFIIDGLQLYTESIQIYMDWELQQTNKYKSKNDNKPSLPKTNSWNIISMDNDNVNKNNLNDSDNNLFGLNLDPIDSNNIADSNLSIPFELLLFWWLIFSGWLCIISYLYFFTIFMSQELNPWTVESIVSVNKHINTNINDTTFTQQSIVIDGVRYACLIMMFGTISGVLTQLFVIDNIRTISGIKLFLILSEFGISISMMSFYFTHAVYHPSFVILLVITLGFLIQIHYQLPYILIEYKMRKYIRKETKRQYYKLQYYCSLMDNATAHNNNDPFIFDMEPIDSFENSAKLMKYEQLKQHILQKYNLTLFFSLIIISIFNGFIINYFQNDFSFSIVFWGILSFIIDVFITILLLFYNHCYRPYKKRRRIKSENQKWKDIAFRRKQAMKYAPNTNYNNYNSSYQFYWSKLWKEKGLKSFIKSNAEIIKQNIARKTASTVKLLDLKRDFRYNQYGSINKGSSDEDASYTEDEDYMEYSSLSERSSPLYIPQSHPQLSQQQSDEYYNYEQEEEVSNEEKEDDNTIMLVQSISKPQNPQKAFIKYYDKHQNELKYLNDRYKKHLTKKQKQNKNSLRAQQQNQTYNY